MKRILFLILVLVVVTSMALLSFSCKNEKTTESEEPPEEVSETVEETTEEETTEEAVQTDKGSVVVTLPDPGCALLEPLAIQFTEETGIEVICETVPGSGPELVAKYSSYWASESSPYDVVCMSDETVASFLNSGWLVTLNDIIPDETWNDFTDTMQARMEVWDSKDGNIMRIPFTAELQMVFANTVLLSENGLEVPTTWDEMIDIGLELKEKSGIYITADSLMKPGYPYCYISFLALQAGGDIFAFDEGTKEAFQFVYDMINIHEIMPSESLSWTYAEQDAAYTNDQIAMARQWTYFYDYAQSVEGWYEDGKAEVVLPPKGPVSNQTWLGAWGWGISQFAPNMENAEKFIAWITQSGEVQSKLIEQDVWFIAARHSVYDALGDEGLIPYIKMYEEANAIGPAPFHVKSVEAMNVVDDTLTAYLSGQLTLDEAMENGQELIEALGPRY